MNMNGSTDPHHHRPGNGGYLGLGMNMPGIGSTAPLHNPGNGGFLGSPGMNAAAAAAAAAAGMGMAGVGPELKHHADFLSRLLAATPSYMNEAGSPPPGFFSDWLRRLVSKPGNSSSSGSGGSTTISHSSHRSSRGNGGGGLTSLSPSSTPTSLQPPLTYSPGIGSGGTSGTGGGQPEMNGSAPLDSHSHGLGSGGMKQRRKRSRLSDHGHQSHSISQMAGKEATSSSHNILDHQTLSPTHLSSQNSGSTLVATSTANSMSHSSSSSAAAAAAAAAAASLNVNPFTHPLWFFPPFLPNPYMNMNPMTMNMNIPPMSLSGLSGLHGNQGPPTSPFLPTPPTSSSDNHTHLHPHLSPHHFGSPPDFLSSLKSRDTVSGEKSKSSTLPPTTAPPTKRSRKEISAMKNKATGGAQPSSFSISRLTSPSPSSNSSGGSTHGGGSGRHNNHPLTIEALNRTISSELPPATSKKGKGERSSPESVCGNSGNSNGGSGTKSGSVCVDLRVSGRIWERSPPPRSIYKPLSAFHDPSDVNLVHSSPKLKPMSPDDTRLPPLKLKLLDFSPVNLSTTYVLKNLTHIYQRVGQTRRINNTPISPNSQNLSKYSALSFLNVNGPSNANVNNPNTSYLDSILSDESNNEEHDRDSRDRNSPFEMFPPHIKRESDFEKENSTTAAPSDPMIKIPLARPSTIKSTQQQSGVQNYTASNGMTIRELDVLEPEEHNEQKIFNHVNAIATTKEDMASIRQDFSDSEQEDILDDDDIVNVMSDDADDGAQSTQSQRRPQNLEKY